MWSYYTVRGTNANVISFSLTNYIINVEILMLIHKTFCQYAPNIQYQYVYPYYYTQGAYYERYASNEYGLNRDTRRRNQYLGHDINIQLDNNQKRLKCKCSKKQERADEASCCHNPNRHTGNDYQYDNKYYNEYHIDTSTPYDLYKSFKFITVPQNMFKHWTLQHFLKSVLSPSTSTVSSVTTTSDKPDGGKTENYEVHSARPDYSGVIADTSWENENTHRTFKDTHSTPGLLATKKLLLFKDSSLKRLCPQRKCYKKIGKYYVNDIIARPTLRNR